MKAGCFRSGRFRRGGVASGMCLLALLLQMLGQPLHHGLMGGHEHGASTSQAETGWSANQHQHDEETCVICQGYRQARQGWDLVWASVPGVGVGEWSRRVVERGVFLPGGPVLTAWAARGPPVVI